MLDEIFTPTREWTDDYQVPVSSSPVPILSAPEGQPLAWEWSGPNPFQWIIQYSFSLTGDSVAGVFFTEDGTARVSGGVADPSYAYRIFGADSEGAVITQLSSWVFYPGADDR